LQRFLNAQSLDEMAKDWKERLGVVYSTNPDYKYESETDDIPTTLAAEKQPLRVYIDRRQRKGKAVTLVSGFVGSDDALKALGKMLKTKCGVGGTAKDGEILIQGDFRDAVYELLLNSGYKLTKRGN
jgi:translation initiation factor 1